MPELAGANLGLTWRPLAACRWPAAVGWRVRSVSSSTVTVTSLRSPALGSARLARAFS